MRRNAQCGLYQIVARQALSPPLVYQPERFKDFTRTLQKCEIGSCYLSQIDCCQTNYGCLKAELKSNYEHPNGHYVDVVCEASLIAHCTNNLVGYANLVNCFCDRAKNSSRSTMCEYLS